MACRFELASSPTQCPGSLVPVSPRMSARAAIPCRNSSGKVANDSSERPSARKPFPVNPTVTHLASATFDPTALAVPTLSIRPVNHARPPFAEAKVRNSYRAALAGGLDMRKCWISSNSSEAGRSVGSIRTPGIPFDCCSMPSASPSLLHEVEHFAERRLELQRFLDFVSCHVRVFTVFQKAGALVFPDELDECWDIGFPVFGKTFKVLKNRVHPQTRE